MYKNIMIGTPLKIDLIVNDIVVVECKSSLKHNEIFEVQLLTYLRITGLKLGLLINFGEKLVSHGVKRIVNGL